MTKRYRSRKTKRRLRKERRNKNVCREDDSLVSTRYLDKKSAHYLSSDVMIMSVIRTKNNKLHLEVEIFDI